MKFPERGVSSVSMNGAPSDERIDERMVDLRGGLAAEPEAQQQRRRVEVPESSRMQPYNAGADQVLSCDGETSTVNIGAAVSLRAGCAVQAAHGAGVAAVSR